MNNGKPKQKDKDTYKILLIGDSLVGKTSFLSRFSGNEFKEKMISTIGCDYSSKEITLNNQQTIVVQLWDTAGQEKFNALTKNMFKGADGILIFYDISDTKTYLSVTRWVDDIKKSAGPNVQLVIVGNKSDLENYRTIKHYQGQELAKSNNALFIETSCYLNKNIDETVLLITNSVYNERLRMAKEQAVSLEEIQKKNQFNLKNKKGGHKKKCCK